MTRVVLVGYIAVFFTGSASFPSFLMVFYQFLRVNAGPLSLAATWCGRSWSPLDLCQDFDKGLFFFRAFPALPHRASGEQAACRARSLRCKSASAATRVRSCSILPYPRRAARPTALHDMALFGGVPFEARAPLALAATDGTTGLCSRV